MVFDHALSSLDVGSCNRKLRTVCFLVLYSPLFPLLGSGLQVKQASVVGTSALFNETSHLTSGVTGYLACRLKQRMDRNTPLYVDVVSPFSVSLPLYFYLFTEKPVNMDRETSFYFLHAPVSHLKKYL